MNKKETEEYFMRMSDGIDLCHTDNDLTPAHYNAEVDVIEFFTMHFGEEDMKKVHLFNIIKYATRFGKKDEELKEVNKIIHYAEMLKESVENENK